jgi:hypothetical protein
VDFATLSIVKFGDRDSLGEFLFFAQGIQVPAFPLADADIDNLDDWLLPHQVEHQSFSALLGLENPFNMLDADWNNEEAFYDWLATHLSIHEQIAAALGLT